jgi:hemerythrin-like metal-binding protein
VERRVATLLDHVQAGRDDGARRPLSDPEAATVAHFAHEEAFMARFAYPQRAPHEEAHARFLADVARFRRELEADGVTSGVRRWAAGRLPEWFRFHVLCHDMALGIFLQREKEAPRPLPEAAGTEAETA